MVVAETVSQSERRVKRYVLLLTPTEFALARKFARRLHRSVPDFFRLRIYELADQLTDEEHRQKLHTPLEEKL